MPEIIEVKKEAKSTKPIRIINSTLMYILSFILLYFIQDFVTSIMASLHGAKPVMYYTSYKFSIKPSLDDASIFLVYLAGPIVCLLIGLFSLKTFNKIKMHRSLLKVLLLWFGVNGFLMFIGQFTLTLMFPEKHLSSIFSHFKLDDDYKIVVFVISVALLIFFGIKLTKYFMYLLNTKYYLKHGSKRKQYIYQVVVLPYIIGSLLCCLFYFPLINLYIVSLLALNGIVVAVTYYNAPNKKYRKLRIHRMEPITRISINALYSLTIIYIVFHLVLYRGWNL